MAGCGFGLYDGKVKSRGGVWSGEVVEVMMVLGYGRESRERKREGGEFALTRGLTWVGINKNGGIFWVRLGLVRWAGVYVEGLGLGLGVGW